MKSKTKNILIGTLATLLIVGGASAVIGVASDGFKNWDTSTWFQDEFKGVKVESKAFAYDGEAKELEIIVPEGATYEVTITKDGEKVTECKELGTYEYVVVVKIGDKTKEYKAELRIVEDSELSFSKLNHIKKAKLSETKYELTASIGPDYATNKKLKWSINWVNPTDSWANGKSVTDYVSIENSGNEKCIVNMKTRFSSQVVVTASTTDGSNLSANCTVDCKKVVVSSDVLINEDARPFNEVVKYHNGSQGKGLIFDLDGLYQSPASSSKINWTGDLGFFKPSYNLSDGTIDINPGSDVSISLDTYSGSINSTVQSLLMNTYSIIMDNEGIQLSGNAFDYSYYYQLQEELAKTNDAVFMGLTINYLNQKHEFPFYLHASSFLANDLHLSDSNIIFE